MIYHLTMLQPKTPAISGLRQFSLLIAALTFVAATGLAQPGVLYTTLQQQTRSFSDPALWPDGNVPPDSSNIQIINSQVTFDGDLVVGTLTLNTGTAGAILGSNTITVLDQFLNNSLTGVTPGTSTVILKSTVADGGSGQVTVGGTNDVTFYNVVIPSNSVVDFDSGGNSNTETYITNQLKMDGGSVVVNPPIYGAASTLLYDDTHTSIGTEWTAGASSGKGVPHHVTVGASSSLDFGSTSSNYTCTGNLTVDGAAASIDLADMTGTLTVDGNASFGSSSAVSLTLPSTEGASKLVVGGDLTLGANATVTGGEANVEVRGNLANSVSDMAFGLLKLNGSADQDITGSKITVDSLVVANTQNAVTNDTDVDFQGDVDIVPGGVFNPIDGTAKITGTFTMNSDATGTARIATLADDGSTSDVDGDITFERYVPSTPSTSWLVMGNYITKTPTMKVQDWADDFGGSIYVYSHDETTNAANCNTCSNGWTYMNSGSTLSNTGEGYFTIVPSSLGTSGHTLSNTGTYSTGNVARTVNHTTGSYSQFHDPAGWNLMVNPYPSPIDGDAFLSANSAVSEYYILDNNSGNWLSSGQVGALAAPDVIDIGQGFYSYVTSANDGGTATFTPSLATYGANTFVRDFDIEEQAIFAVKIEDAEGRFGATTIRLHEAGEEAYQDGLDAPYKPSSALNPKIYSTLSSGEHLAVNTPSSLATAEQIALTIETGFSGTVEVSLDEATALAEGLCVRFIDSVTGDVIALGNESLTLYLEASTIYTDRFFLEFDSTPVFEATTSYCQGGTIHFEGENAGDWMVTWQENETGTGGSGCVTDLPPGTYEMEATNNIEVCYTSATLEISEMCLGDFNQNGGRDIPDLLRLLVELQPSSGQDGSVLATDCDCDGVMTTSDLLLFLPQFGATCE